MRQKLFVLKYKHAHYPTIGIQLSNDQSTPFLGDVAESEFWELFDEPVPARWEVQNNELRLALDDECDLQVVGEPRIPLRIRENSTIRFQNVYVNVDSHSLSKVHEDPVFSLLQSRSLKLIAPSTEHDTGWYEADAISDIDQAVVKIFLTPVQSKNNTQPEFRLPKILEHGLVRDLHTVIVTPKWLGFGFSNFDGQSIRNVIRQQGPFAIPRALGIITQLLKIAMKCAHAGCRWPGIHPWEIYLSNRGDVQLMGTGLRTLRKSIRGGRALAQRDEWRDPDSGAPEQATVVFQLAQLLFELVTGYPPRKGSESNQAEAYRVDLPDEVLELLQLFGSLDHNERPATLTEALVDVRSVLSRL